MFLEFPSELDGQYSWEVHANKKVLGPTPGGHRGANTPAPRARHKTHRGARTLARLRRVLSLKD